MRSAPTVLAVAFLVVGLTGCGGSTHPGSTEPPRTASPQPTQSSPTTASTAVDRAGPPRIIGTIATGLVVPWGIAFLPDGSALVTERDSGRVLHLSPPHSDERHGRWRSATVGHIGESDQPGGEAGLLGVAVSPSYSRDHRVFFYVSSDHDNRILRATYDGGRLGPPRAILTGIPRGVIHDGGRLAFGPDGYLYASTGETGDRALAQDPHSLGGKILRITQSGRPAPGDPHPGSSVWTLGHRNVQGLAWSPGGHLWASEFGDQTWDELNLIVRGANYGWPTVEGQSTLSRFRNPVAVWHTDQASPSGLAYDAGSLWLGALHGERLWRVPVRGTRIGDPKDYFVGSYGRMRTVVTAPDGKLWVTTSNRDGRGAPRPGDDRILLVQP